MLWLAILDQHERGDQMKVILFQRQHVEAMRVDNHLSAATKLIASVDDTAGGEAKKSKDSSKKMLKKAEKLARKAEKLARKAAAMQAAD